MRPNADHPRRRRVHSPTRRTRTGRRDERRTMARPLDPDGQALVEAFRTLAYRLGWYFARARATDVPPDELIAEAFYALTYAAGMFRQAKGVPFGAYATMVIRHRLTKAILSWRKARRVVPFPLAGLTDEYPWEAPDPKSGPEPAARV